MDEQQKILKMNTNLNLFKMSIPLFVELMLQLMVGNMDQIMISHYSQKSVAAIVNGNQIMNLVIIVLNMISMGTTVVLSQYLGARDKEGTSKTCMMSLTLITGISIFLTIVVIIFHRNIFKIMNIGPDILDEASTYFVIIASFILVQGFYLNFAAILRTFTLMKEVMFISIIMNILNICGNAILINGLFGVPQLGIKGAAISTVISKIIGLIIIIYLFKKKLDVSLGIKYLKPFPVNIMNKLCKIAFPSGIESFSYNLSQMCILGVINTFGTMVTATKGYCSILANFSFIYAIALSQATQIMIGYLIGAKLFDAIEKRVWNTVRVSLTVCLGFTLILYLKSDLVLQMFTNDPEVLQLGKRILFIEFFLEIGRAINIGLIRALIAVGDVKAPMIAGVIGQWAVALTFSYIFGKVFGWGLEGVWIAMAMDECGRGFVFFLRFRRNKWKRYLDQEGI
ncbi:MATE family efflux transporter [Anaerocolumna sedimenticola]|uniref:MATE family efflux transporter n=1 Tax=Anaerocolumna sedimenticola TaxID=2696063 RepID=A0A6P1TE48_9FIRM|nr:MATE family efflux transporter [Anaerocolumna sedimenticola]QHQ59510.1 MATE family efflux transporter [Anaerocolumna sedimenticola]